MPVELHFVQALLPVADAISNLLLKSCRDREHKVTAQSHVPPLLQNLWLGARSDGISNAGNDCRMDLLRQEHVMFPKAAFDLIRGPVRLTSDDDRQVRGPRARFSKDVFA